VTKDEQGCFCFAYNSVFAFHIVNTGIDSSGQD
jgi:hypothetical protein